MHPLANPGIVWPVVVILYLALQPAWSYLGLWAIHSSGRVAAWVAGLDREPYRTWLRAAGGVLYGLLIPYLALLLGVADARRLGLVGFPGWRESAFGLLIGLVGIAFLAWSWERVGAVIYQRSGHRKFFSGEWQAFRTPLGWADIALEVLCLQTSWAFVRGGMASLAGLYAGTFAGLGLTAAAWLVRPGNRDVLQVPEERARALLTGELAVVTALVYLYAENVWLCLLVHGLGLFAATLAAGRAYAEGTA